ncbi:MAG: tetratricopeptide repeat protein, partial [Sedimentisphaerales bacterium]|nr:tetratricopeptide repeat protein [Sedimentisphaerales bacterium]
MYGKTVLLILSLGLGLLPLSPVFAKAPGVLLQEGMYAEDVDGNLEAAINSYRQVIESPEATDAQASHAMYRLGLCQMKMQQNSQAATTFQQIIERYPNQTATIEKVKPLLADLVNHDPATLMPADTKIYIEFGSPGKQVETILNMLKGTPLENPLQALGAGGAPGQSTSPDDKTPQDLVASMLNPSMIAEFKKIRGMAVGVSKITMDGGEPTFVGVLDPGKSDALRGLILMALGMFGQPGDPIEGMQTYRIQPDPQITIHVAHDNNIILIAQPFEQFQWCVRQYKGLIQAPSLASQNPAFGRIPRQQRSQNALTIWMDGAGVYSQIPDPLKQDVQFQMIDGLVDLGSLREVLSQFTLKEQGLVWNTEINLQEGHHCLPYQMLRTPNLSKGGFEGVPANAIGLISFALDDPQGPLATQAQRAVREMIGLDIGRELFANIEQVTIFATPPSAAAEQGVLSRELSPL